MIISECVSPIDIISPSPKLTYVAVSMRHDIKVIGPGKIQRYFSAHKYKINLIVWSKDERFLGTSSFAGECIIWDVEHHRVINFRVLLSKVCQMHFEPGSKLVYELDRKGNFQIREGSTRKVFIIKGSAWDDQRIVEFATSLQNGLLALVYRNGNIRLYKDFTVVQEIFCHKPFTNLMFNADGSYLCCICRNDELFVYESDTGKRTYLYTTPTLTQITFLNLQTVMGLSKGEGFYTIETYDLAKEKKLKSRKLNIDQTVILVLQGQQVVYKTIKRTGDCSIDYVKIEEIEKLVQQIQEHCSQNKIVQCRLNQSQERC